MTNLAKILKVVLVLSVLSQILLPIYSDANFKTLALGELVHQTNHQEVLFPWGIFGEMYTSIVYAVHSNFADLGLVIFEFVLMLALSYLIFSLLPQSEPRHEHFAFFLYLISLVGVFYGRDLSIDYFFLLLVLIGLAVKNKIARVLILGVVLCYFMQGAEFELSPENKPIGESFLMGIYSLAVNGLLLTLSVFLLNVSKKSGLIVVALVGIFVASFFNPFFRMIFSVFSLLFILNHLSESEGLCNISRSFSKLTESLRFLFGYALVFFLLAFSFSQAGGVFTYPLTTLFMPVEKVDRLIEEPTCLSNVKEFSPEEHKRYSGYFLYREVFALKTQCR